MSASTDRPTPPEKTSALILKDFFVARKLGIPIHETNANPRTVRVRHFNQPELAMGEYRACLDLSPDFRDALWRYGEMLGLACDSGLKFAARGNVSPAFQEQVPSFFH